MIFYISWFIFANWFYVLIIRRSVLTLVFLEDASDSPWFITFCHLSMFLLMNILALKVYRDTVSGTRVVFKPILGNDWPAPSLFGPTPKFCSVFEAFEFQCVMWGEFWAESHAPVSTTRFQIREGCSFDTNYLWAFILWSDFPEARWLILPCVLPIIPRRSKNFESVFLRPSVNYKD